MSTPLRIYGWYTYANTRGRRPGGFHTEGDPDGIEAEGRGRLRFDIPHTLIARALEKHLANLVANSPVPGSRRVRRRVGEHLETTDENSCMEGVIALERKLDAIARARFDL